MLTAVDRIENYFSLRLVSFSRQAIFLHRLFINPTSNLSVASVVSGKRYRFRMISMACDPSFTVTIQGHNMLTCIYIVSETFLTK
ncbi:hypothetical protein F5146DRAFT_1029644 [Armillaria mellea]|nr:hypothetical protein F5146DRAFT_1029644 [Armillaria mellea]